MADVYHFILCQDSKTILSLFCTTVVVTYCLLDDKDNIQVDAHSAFRDYLSTSTGRDLPPKYEEIEDLPPEYNEATMAPQFSSTCTGNEQGAVHSNGCTRATLN